MWSRKQARRINKGNDVDLPKTIFSHDRHPIHRGVGLYLSIKQRITSNCRHLSPNSLLSLFLHLEAQRLDSADNLFGGGRASHGDEAAGEVGIYVLRAG